VSGVALNLADVKSPAVRAVAILAGRAGWHVRKTARTAAFNAPGVESFQLPLTGSSIRSGVMAQRVRHVIRYAPEPFDVAAAVDEALGAVKLNVDQARAFRRAALGAVMTEVAQQAGTEVQAPPAPTETAVPAKAPDVARPIPVVVVSERPARAVQGSRPDGAVNTYPSPTAMERRWSDGSVDFPCRWPGCEYVGRSLRSTSNHYRAHEKVGTLPPADGVATDHVPEPRIGARVDRLAAELAAARDAGIDPTDAEATARFVIERRVERNDHSDAEAVELSPDQILDRIARLVDRGETPRLRAEVDDLTERLAAAEQRAQLAEDTMGALRDLLDPDYGKAQP